jgi:hypothetical protein
MSMKEEKENERNRNHKTRLFTVPAEDPRGPGVSLDLFDSLSEFVLEIITLLRRQQMLEMF